MKNAKSQPLITKSELSLLFGGFIFLSSCYFVNKSMKNTESVKKEIVLKNEKYKTKKESKKTDRNIAQSLEFENKNSNSNDPLSTLKIAETCIESKACDLPNNDPRAYSLAAYSNLASEIDANRFFITTNWNSEREVDFKRFFKYSNGFVKEAALRTVLALKDRELLAFTNELAINIIHDHNAQMMDLTMEFIDRIQDTNVKDQIENEWIQAMITGSPNKSEALAKYSHELINEQSIPKFKKALNKLPKGSPERTHLESSVREFEMTQAGG